MASISRAGRMESMDGRNDVERARLVLEVVPGERRLLPEFGCRMHLLPSIRTAAERHLAEALVEEALESWAPDLRFDRAEIREVEDGWILLALRKQGSWFELRLAHRFSAPSGAFDQEAEEDGMEA